MPQARPGSYRPGRAPKTMAVKHMAFFQGGSGSVKSGAGLGSVADMWGDGVVSGQQLAVLRPRGFVGCSLGGGGCCYVMGGASSSSEQGVGRKKGPLVSCWAMPGQARIDLAIDRTHSDANVRGAGEKTENLRAPRSPAWLFVEPFLSSPLVCFL